MAVGKFVQLSHLTWIPKHFVYMNNPELGVQVILGFKSKLDTVLVGTTGPRCVQ